MTVVTLGYLGWIATVLIFTFNNYTDLDVNTEDKDTSLLPSRSLLIRIFVPLSLGYSFLYLQRSSETYYLYFLFPVIFWAWVVGHMAPTFRYLARSFSGSSKLNKDTSKVNTSTISSSPSFSVFFSFFIMQSAVVGYFYREVFVVALFGVAFWTYCGMTSSSASRIDVLVSIFGPSVRHVSLHKLWWISCILVGIFPLIPLNFGESVPLVYVSFSLSFDFANTLLIACWEPCFY